MSLRILKTHVVRARKSKATDTPFQDLIDHNKLEKVVAKKSQDAKYDIDVHDEGVDVTLTFAYSGATLTNMMKITNDLANAVEMNFPELLEYHETKLETNPKLTMTLTFNKA